MLRLVTIPFALLVVMVPGCLSWAEPLPVDYWRVPIPPQGASPASWDELERSLAPESCGQCHVDRFKEWRGSLHAGAFSPGLVGQLLTYDADETRDCMICHAPLAEQAAAFEAARAKGKAHEPAEQGIAATGNGCASCHVRGHRHFGPPQRETGLVGQSPNERPHGGAMRSADFEKPEFCAACHQFPQSLAINGKPLENTVEEWRDSPQAASGITCQGCHMPDRRHLWRGIHDPAMVASGLTPRFSADSSRARFTLTNSGVGHAFPTYVTPTVVIHAVALDTQGRTRPETAVSHVIRRWVVYANDAWIEESDTRLLPGETAELAIPWGVFRRVRMWLEVRPDDFYDHTVYDGLLASLPPGTPSARLIAEADARARASRFHLFETEIDRR